MIVMEDLLTLEEVGKRLGVSKWTVKRYIDQGLLEGVQVGPRFWRVRPEALKRYIEKQIKPEEKK